MLVLILFQGNYLVHRYFLIPLNCTNIPTQTYFNLDSRINKLILLRDNWMNRWWNDDRDNIQSIKFTRQLDLLMNPTVCVCIFYQQITNFVTLPPTPDSFSEVSNYCTRINFTYSNILIKTCITTGHLANFDKCLTYHLFSQVIPATLPLYTSKTFKSVLLYYF